MEIILLKPYGGIANRLFAINAGIELKRKFQCKLKILWEKNIDLGCNYEDIFLPTHEFETKNFRSFYWLNPTAYFNIYNTFHPSHYKHSLFNQIFGREKHSEIIFYNHPGKKIHFDFDFASMENQKSMFIAAHNFFFGSLDSFFEFKPTPQLQKTVCSIARNFNYKTIGLHIRRTDHPDAPKYSTDKSFILKIDALIRNDHNFYLSTDSYSIKNRFKSLYGDKILIQETESLERNTKSGIQDAIVDLFCLSRTTRILGSFGSSYSQLAARLNQIPLDIIVNNV